ncbi:hypothetical protein R3X26_05305 [Vibrio sp. TH_r3]|uniref:hypothetical protein n=1 Tax=Vibrio sp. TH_r3 TaxID=3082084 RepID=UPI002954066A|nr:hypothetical protein [Vibrio sp. TH_r3]MDV7103825.1 hypothetical protein [Vibrio sp. TH_r3]
MRNLAVILWYFVSISFAVTSLGVHANTEKVQHNGLGGIVFGQPLKSASVEFKPYGQQVEGCQYVTTNAYPSISVMVVDEIIVRLDSSDIQLIKSDSPFYGLSKGTMTLSSFKRLYPEIEVALHEYENGVYLRWYNQDESKAIVVDYIGGKIERIKAGIVPDVLFVEGCA